MKVVFGILFVGCVVAFGIFLNIPVTQGQKEQKEQNEPTVIQKGRVTDKEREYSKEYKKLYSYRKASKLTDLIELSKRRGNKEEIGISIGVPDLVTVGDSQFPTASEFLRELSCKADAIVIGSTKSKTAHITEDETFIYTEYEFSVDDVLKNNSLSPVEVSKSIQITRPGGLIRLDNQIIRAEDMSYETLQKDKKYMLFLHFIPSASGYVVSSAEGDFELQGESFTKLTRLIFPSEIAKKNSDSLITDVRNSISSDCPKDSKEGN